MTTREQLLQAIETKDLVRIRRHNGEELTVQVLGISYPNWLGVWVPETRSERQFLVQSVASVEAI